MNLKNVAIGIAIIILTSFVTIYGIALIYPEPEYNSYCDSAKQGIAYDTEQSCIAAQGKWNTVAPYKEVPSEKTITGYCDSEFYCRQDYDADMKNHFKKVFYVALPLGVIVIIVGAIFFGLESVGAGLMGGGIITLIYGAGGYWQYAQNYLKFLISLAGLIAIIYFAYWFNKRSEKNNKKKR
jgi:hypothetical protein